MLNRKKILILTPRFPYPVIGGDRLRIYEVCKELAKSYQLTLVSLCESPFEMTFDLPDDGVFNEVHRVYLPKWRSYINCLLSLPTSKPLQVSYYQSKKFKRLVDELSKQHDMVLPHLIRTAEYAKNLSIAKVIEMTDAISMNYTRVSQLKNISGIRGIIYRIERKRLNRYEKSIAEYFDYSVLVSHVDRDFLYYDNNKLLQKSLICSNGVDLSKLPYSFIPGDKKLVFIGNMHSVQNFDAAYWFSKTVMPLLRQHGPYKFHIIGQISADNKKKLQQLDGVVVTGAVDSVVEHARGALAGICSVRLAAGIQNKILEYMALGIPCVTSTTGLEGLFARDGESVLVADSPEEYVMHILSLKENRFFAESIAKSAYSYVKEQHSWSGKLHPLVYKINQLL